MCHTKIMGRSHMGLFHSTRLITDVVHVAVKSLASRPSLFGLESSTFRYCDDSLLEVRNGDGSSSG